MMHVIDVNMNSSINQIDSDINTRDPLLLRANNISISISTIALEQ